MHEQPGNTSAKFCAKIPSGFSENDKQLSEFFFAARSRPTCFAAHDEFSLHELTSNGTWKHYRIAGVALKL